MKNLIRTFSFLLIMGLALTLSGNASAQFSQSNPGSTTGTTITDAGAPVEGTVTTVDPVAGVIIITETASGTDQTFTASQEDLRDVQPGDRVRLTPDKNDSSTAEKVEKQ